MTQQNQTEKLSGLATINQTVAGGIGALHLRVRVEEFEYRFLFTGQDFFRIVSGQRAQGYDRDAYDERVHPIRATPAGDMIIFEVFGHYFYRASLEEIKNLWSFETPCVQIMGSFQANGSRLEEIAIRGMKKVLCPDKFPPTNRAEGVPA